MSVESYFSRPEDQLKHSTASKAITELYKTSPELEISFSLDLLGHVLNDDSESSISRSDFLTILGRISNYLVPNTNLRFVKLDKSTSNVFHYMLFIIFLFSRDVNAVRQS